MVILSSYPGISGKIFRASAVFLLLSFYPATGQEATYNYFYRVFFRDKGQLNTNEFTLSDLFSVRAVERRQKSGSHLPDFRDIPVNKDYLDQITLLGFRLHCTSRWMNTALFKTVNSSDINGLLNLPFVSDVKMVKNPGLKSKVETNYFFRLMPMVRRFTTDLCQCLTGMLFMIQASQGQVCSLRFLTGDSLMLIIFLHSGNFVRGTG